MCLICWSFRGSCNKTQVAIELWVEFVFSSFFYFVLILCFGLHFTVVFYFLLVTAIIGNLVL